MRLALLLAVFVGSVVSAEPAQRARQPRGTPAPAPPSTTTTADAYGQYLLGRHLEREDNIEGAIAAFKRAAALDPTAADVQAELAGLYMRQNRIGDALTTAEQALKVAPGNREAHRVLGTIYAAVSDTDARAGRSRPGQKDENAAKAIEHLEQALSKSEGEPDQNVQANLARMYVRTGANDKAIPLLRTIVDHEPGWQDGVSLLIDAYAAAGRNAEAITWLEENAADNPRLYATLGDFYDRERRYKDSARVYALAVQRAPRNADLKVRYAAALMNVGSRENFTKARDLLDEVVKASPSDPRALYLLSQAQRRTGDAAAAETTARRLIGVNGRSPWGYYALAEALQERQQYQAVIDTLAPAINEMRSRSANDALGMLLPHVGFAYEQLGQYEQAIAAFDEAHRLAPSDVLVMGYLIQSNLSAKKYPAAAELARLARVDHPDDLRLARLHAQALQKSGQADQAASVLEGLLKKQSDRPVTYVALAQLYTDAKRGADAVKLLEEAEGKFPADTSIPFELGAVLEKQKRFAESEAAFRRVLQRDPEHAPALNYLGYMLADRGERLEESVEFVKKALEIDPDNGSYLDSLGWAYYKSNKLELAADNLRRAADQLKTNSVIQDHYGDLLFKMARYDAAIEAWMKALTGDGDSIDRAGIDKKIKSAQQKIGKK
jgi:tetratricopeptide (TPR) repeat protein